MLCNLDLYLNDNIINDAKNVVLERFELNYSRYWCLFHSINKTGGINKYNLVYLLINIPYN